MADILIYNGQHKNGGVEEVAKAFTKETGIKVKFKQGKSQELLALIKEEGSKSPADILITESTAAFVDLSSKGMLDKINPDTLKNVESKVVAKSLKGDYVPLASVAAW